MRQHLPPARNRSTAHPLLLLQRYVAHPADGSTAWQQAKPAIHDAARTVVPCELYKAAFERWQKSLPELTAATTLRTAGRLIVGLGSENVLETGITLHHTYGMPILPGSALKGLAAHYCDQVWGAAEEKFKKGGPYHALLFGTTDESGCVIFHDAWFVPDSEKEPLKLDVMTPHHPKWLDGSAPPTDFDSPTPVPFLSVAGSFQVAVSWCGPVDPEHKYEWFFARAAECLRHALFHWGIGGKTTSGYGRFDETKWKADEAARAEAAAKQSAVAAQEAARAAMSPIERSIEEFLANHPDKQAKVSIKLLKELEKDGGRFQDPEDRKFVAARVKAAMQQDKEWKDKEPFGKRKKYIQQILGEL